MSDFNFKFLKFGKSDKQVSLDNFAGEVKKEDIKDKKLLQLFDFFDADKSGILEATEVKNLWNNVVTKATSDGDSIFEKAEVKEYLSETVNERGESLKSLGINFKEMFSFLNVINDKKNECADINNPDTWDILPQETGEEPSIVDKPGYNELKNLLNDTADGFINFLETEGCISHFVNAIRTGKKHAKREDVETALIKVAKDLKFLRAAYEGRLMCGDKKVDFETAFKTLMGVDYSEENIKDCNKKSETYAKADATNKMVNSLIDELKHYSKTNGVASAIDNPVKFNKSFLTLFSQLLNIQDYNQINLYLSEFCEQNKDNPVMKDYGGEIKLVKLSDKEQNYYGQEYALMRKTNTGNWEPLTSEQMQLIADYTINEKLVPVKAVLLGLGADSTNEDCENYVAKCKKDYEEAFKTAYGTQELSVLLDDYVQGQQNGMMVVNIASSVAMMAATFFTGGVTSVAMMGLMMTQPVELLEKLTDGDGATWKDIEEHGYQVLKSLPWMALGMGAGKLGDLARAACKLKGLQTLASRSGKTIDQIIKEVGENNLGKDAVKLLKQANKIAQATGFTTEVSVDLATTRAFQKEGLTTQDWIMSFVGALQGTVMQKKLAGMDSKSAQIDYIQKQFKGTLDLTADEAKMVIESMINTNNLPRILDDVEVTAPSKSSNRPEMGIEGYKESSSSNKESTPFSGVSNRINQRKNIFYLKKQKIAKKYRDAAANRIDHRTPPEIFDIIDDPVKIEAFIKNHTVEVPIYKQIYNETTGKFETVISGTRQEIQVSECSYTLESFIEEITHLRNLQEFLDTQAIPNKMTTYRHDSYDIFNQIYVGGKTLKEAIQDAIQNGKMEDIVAMLNLGQTSITFNNFVGTSMKNNYTSNVHVMWEINVPKNYKGAYIEAMTKENIPDETEFLLQRGTQLKITGADYKDGVLFLKADANLEPRAQVVNISVDADGTFAVEIGDEVFIAKNMDEVHKIIAEKARTGSIIDLSEVKYEDDICAGDVKGTGSDKSFRNTEEEKKYLRDLFNVPGRNKYPDSILDLFIDEMVRIADENPDVSRETIFNLAKNPSMNFQIIDGKIRGNLFKKVVDLCSRYPEQKEALLNEIGSGIKSYTIDITTMKRSPNYYEFADIYEAFDNPKFTQLLDIVGVHHALNQLADGMADIGPAKYEQLNSLLYGEVSPKQHTIIKTNIKEKYNIELHLDNNINADQITKYQKTLEEYIQRYKESGRELPKEIYITKLCPEGADGVAWASKYPDIICVRPSDNQNYFKHCLFHESVHLTDMVHKIKELQYKPVGTYIRKIDGVITVFKKNDANLKAKAQKYISQYSAFDTNEFIAELGAMILENKIIIEDVIILPDGTIDTKITIPEPFTNIDGKQIEITPEARADIESLLSYYFSIGGQDYPSI